MQKSNCQPSMALVASKRVLLILILGMFIPVATFSQPSTSGLHVSGRFLRDGDGQQVILRGPELVVRWGEYYGLTPLGLDVPWEGWNNGPIANVPVTIREIARTGSNALRILGGLPHELDSILQVAIFEQKMFVSIARVDWANPELISVLSKYRDYLILHPRGEFTHRDSALWRTEALNVVRQMRALGYTSPIEIGTTGYGQHWPTIATHGQEIFQSDPLRNTLFLMQLYSEHAREVDATLDRVAAYPHPVNVGACLFAVGIRSGWGNTLTTYREVWEKTLTRNISSFYWDWWGDGENSMSIDGSFNNLTEIGRYIVHESPAALINTVKTPFLLRAGLQPTNITPFVQVDGGEWSQTSSVSVQPGSRVMFGPQPVSEGTWSWSGPSGFSASTREIILDAVRMEHAGNYVVTHTNSVGIGSSHTFRLTVSATASVVDEPVMANSGAKIDNHVLSIAGGSSGLVIVSIINLRGDLVYWETFTGATSIGLESVVPQGSFIVRVQGDGIFWQSGYIRK